MDDMLMRVEGAFKAGQYDEVIRLTGLMLESPVEPCDEARVLALRGRAYRRLGYVGQALSCLIDAGYMAKDARLTDLWAELLVDQMALLAAIPDRNRCEEIAVELRELTSLGNPAARNLEGHMHFNLAVCYEWSGLLEKAAAEYAEASSDLRLAGYALINRAGLMLLLGKTQQARVALDQASQMAPQLALRHVYEAWHTHLAGSSDMALAMLDACLPDSDWIRAEVHLVRARVLYTLGSEAAREEATAAIEAACRATPEHGQVVRQARMVLRAISGKGGMTA